MVNVVKRNFEEWLSTFTPIVKDYEYYVDFKKVVKNTEKMKFELNLMNSLIGSRSIEQDFIDLVTEYPKVLKCIPLLIAVRSKNIPVLDKDKIIDYKFGAKDQDPKFFVEFMKKTGLFDMIQNHVKTNLYDYVLGVETGLDSHARKNRTGTTMERIVEEYVKLTGKKYSHQ